MFLCYYVLKKYLVIADCNKIIEVTYTFILIQVKTDKRGDLFKF